MLKAICNGSPTKQHSSVIYLKFSTATDKSLDLKFTGLILHKHIEKIKHINVGKLNLSLAEVNYRFSIWLDSIPFFISNFITLNFCMIPL